MLAAGAGTRMADDGVPKALRRVGGEAMYLRALAAFDAAEGIMGSVLVIPAIWAGDVMEGIQGRFERLVHVVPGGETRQASVQAALDALEASATEVVIHDAARPLVTSALIERARAGLAEADAVICAVPMPDTVKRVDGARVVETLDRSALVRVQTPQAFRVGPLRAAHARARADGFVATDDAALIERDGGTVVVVDGDERNVKVTTATDLVVAEALLAGGS